MKFEFNEDGSLKIPKLVKEIREYSKEKLNEARQNPNKVIIKYEQESDYEDNWIITLPNNVPKSLLYKLKKWTDNQHNPVKGSTWINELEKNKFVLVVKGYGLKCTWSHAFLNGLNTALIRDYKTNIKQTRTCKHKFYVKN